MATNTFICPKCGEQRTEAERGRTTGAQCKPCIAVYMRDWKRKKDACEPQPVIAKPTPAPKVEPNLEITAQPRTKRGPKPVPDDYIPIVNAPKQAPPPIPPSTNYTREATEHELELLAQGAAILRQCVRPHFALDVVTDAWWGMNRSET